MRETQKATAFIGDCPLTRNLDNAVCCIQSLYKKWPYFLQFLTYTVSVNIGVL